MDEGGGPCGGEGDFEFVTCVAAASNEVGGCGVGCDGVEDLNLMFDARIDVGGTCQEVADAAVTGMVVAALVGEGEGGAFGE